MVVQLNSVGDTGRQKAYHKPSVTEVNIKKLPQFDIPNTVRR